MFITNTELPTLSDPTGVPENQPMWALKFANHTDLGSFLSYIFHVANEWIYTCWWYNINESKYLIVIINTHTHFFASE